MSEPVPITIEQVRAGDKILIHRVINGGEDREIIMTVQGVVAEGVVVGTTFRFSGSPTWYSRTDADTITLLHRPPTRRAITADDLKDWQKVPIGTHIEFKCADTGSTVSGKLIARTETNSWSIAVSGHCFRYLSSIKPGTLFVIEEAKP